MRIFANRATSRRTRKRRDTMRATTIILAIACSTASALGLSFAPSDEVEISTIHPANRPSIAEQAAAAVTLITDSILSPELAAVAVVQSRKAGLLRIDAARIEHYNIENVEMLTIDQIMSALNMISLGKIVRALNFTPLYLVETVYAGSELPSILAMIQDRMYRAKLIIPTEKPLNFRPALFPDDDTVWLVFLKSDSVFNYEMSPLFASIAEQEIINNVLANQATVAGFKEGFMLEGVLSEENQFSLVEYYANFPLQKPGIAFTPFIIGEENFTSAEQLHPSGWTGDPLDFTNELILPEEFLEDLRLIMQFAAAYEADLPLPTMQTPLGGQVLDRVRERLGEGASNAHLHADWLRPPLTDDHHGPQNPRGRGFRNRSVMSPPDGPTGR